MEETQVEKEYQKTIINGYTLISYTEKSIVVTGEKTKEIKDQLKEIGGKWNAHLKCGKGWIFASKHREKIIKLLSN